MEHEFEQEFRMLGLKIAYYRKANNLTQEQLAEKLGTTTSYIGSIESKTYSVMHGNEQLFASKYKLYLPTEDELRAEIETQKAMFYLQQQDNME